MTLPVLALWCASTGTFFLAALACWRARREAPAMRAMAVALALGGVANIARQLLAALVLAPARVELGEGVPYTGIVRAAFHAEQGLLLAWWATVAGLVWRAVGRRADGVLGAFLGALAGAAALYPGLRGVQLVEVVYPVLTGLFSLVGAAALVHLRAEHRARLDLRVSLVLLAGLSATLLGPFAGSPLRFWWVSMITWSFAMIAICVLVVGRLRSWRIRSFVFWWG